MTTPNPLPLPAAFVRGIDLMGVTTTLNPLRTQTFVRGHVLLIVLTE